MNIPPDQLRFAMRRWATGVVIVSAVYDGITHGMTVSSFTSLSLMPPLVMVSLEHSTRTHDLVKAGERFGVSVLAEAQQAISDRFSDAGTELGERFSGIETFILETGVPFISGGLSFLDCRVTDQLNAGTHTVFVGEVVAVEEGPHHPPLLYFNQAYHRLT